VPGTVGLTLAVAKREMRLADCRVEVRRRASSLLQVNRVLQQNPRRSRKLAVGTKVILVVGNGPKTETLPSVGDRLARRLPPYIAYDAPTGGIWLMKPDGTDAHQIAPLGAAFPVWSPDATEILYTAPAAQNNDGNYAYIMNADGSDPRPIMPAGAYYSGDLFVGGDFDFRWSPDGNRVVFTHSMGPFDEREVEIANADGSDVHPVTPSALGAGNASYSPDGRWIVVDTDTGAMPTHGVAAWRRKQGLYVIRSDGGEIAQITFGGGVEDPSWSPDGKRIVYGCLLDKYGQAHAICELSGRRSRQRILYQNKNEEFLRPTWNANGTKILVTIEQPDFGPAQIALMFPSGGEPIEIGVPLLPDTYPDW